ncbi:MAG: CHASE2 domain-containing protein [Thermodesulfobacteriota bacterium]|nr:CHASE2 domain-containing protein [Thermodesulfobacteriota bacterium]
MHKILTLPRLSPFKLGCLVILVSALLFCSFYTKPVLLTTLDNRLIDLLFDWRGSLPVTDNVVIVDIDDESLAKIGQWPWPRDTVAKLVSTIHANGAVVIGFDIVFPEPDRTSPKNFISELAQLIGSELSDAEIDKIRQNKALDHDIILGDALVNAPSVPGYSFVFSDQEIEPGNAPFPSCNIHLDSTNIAFSETALEPAAGCNTQYT